MMRTICLLTAFIAFPLSALSDDAQRHIPEIDELVASALQREQMPGAVVIVGAKDTIIHRAAYGFKQLEPTRVEMTLDTIFDVASLTKPVATATAVLLLVDRGELDLDAPISATLPEFGNDGKETITAHHLLTHTSGLIADNSIRDYQNGPDSAWDRICKLKPVAPVGERFIYSDVGFIVLGKLVERISGEPLNTFTQEQLFQPLKMNETCYLPAASLKDRCAPANREGDSWVQGMVHDPRARGLGGVAGHAGVFSTGDDLVRYARMVLNRGELDGVRVFKPETIDAMLLSRPVPGPGLRTWGWDRKTGYSSNRGEGMSDLAIGHGGFTGTGLWIDSELDLFVIFLSNRLHPNGKGSVNRLIGEIGTVAVKARKTR